MKNGLFITFACLFVNIGFAQQNYVSHVWVADQGDGTFKNPILYADYSDPDVCRAGDDYYMTASSFNAVPGLPILHSKDLVNWKLIGHALQRQLPEDHFSKVQHGNGVWAPSIRYHNNEFWIYYPDPDFGIYLVKAKDPKGPWSEPVLVESGKGLIDPCPLWDDNGKVYLVHAFAGSRAGIKSILVVKQLSEDGTHVIDEGKLIYDGHTNDPTVEGPKFYKRNGYYYIFAPAGGVATGWQVALRSKTIYGPYERKVVMDQGHSSVNGPHQGAWVDTTTGEHWFIHFQDKGVYGRIVHLQPLRWINDWPVIGDDKDSDGKGEPVATGKKPNVGKKYAVETPAETDEFDGLSLALQWQWRANPKAQWYFLDPSQGTLRLYSQKVSEEERNFWNVPNLLLQKLPSEKFMITTSMNFTPKLNGDRAGIILFGLDYASLSIVNEDNRRSLVLATCSNADKGSEEKRSTITQVNEKVFLRIRVKEGGVAYFSYSLDGKKYMNVGESFQVREGKWVGAKMGIFCTSITTTNDSGFADFDWFRVESDKER